MKRVIFSIAAMVSSMVTGNPEIGAKFTDIRSVGHGCPRGSAAFDRGPDAQSFTMLFDGFSVQPVGLEAVRSSCTVVAHVDALQGYTVAIRPIGIDVDFEFSGSSSGVVNIDSTFAGHNERINTRLSSGSNRTVVTGDLGWSRCGADADLRIALSIGARRLARNDAARVTVLQSQPVELVWRRCP